MERGVIQIYYGEGRGKSTAALGNACVRQMQEKMSLLSSS